MASGGYVEFGAALDKFQVDTVEAVTAVARVLGEHVLGQLVQRSPVGFPPNWASKPPKGYVGGRFKGNWQLSIDAPIEGEIDRIDPDGTATVEAGKAVLATAPSLPNIWITQNLPYSEELEGGHSDQAPFGMLALTYSEIIETYATDAQRILEEMELA
jgi:hypothetical protein